jgi:hypothetical protein
MLISNKAACPAIDVASCQSRRYASEEERQPMKMTGCHRETSAAVPREPRLSEVLNDPIVMAVMRADGVSPDELARILRIPDCSRSFGGPDQSTEIGSPGSRPRG